jgi:hypothetical protein
MFDTGLSGRLVISTPDTDPWGKLEVPQSLIRGVFDAMEATGVQLPEGSAHITVFTTKELKKIGVENIKERGKRFKYRIRGIKRVEPEGWKEMQYVYFLTCSSPELEALRASYGLTPKVMGDHPFHITVAVLPKKTVKNIKKSAAEDEDPEEQERKERKRAIMKALLIGTAGTAVGYGLYRKLRAKGVPVPEPDVDVTPAEPDTVGQSPVAEPSNTETRIDAATTEAPVPPEPETYGQALAQWRDSAKDEYPEPYHPIVDQAFDAVRTGNAQTLEALKAQAPQLPEGIEPLDLTQDFDVLGELMQVPEMQYHRNMNEAFGVDTTGLSPRGLRMAEHLGSSLQGGRVPNVEALRAGLGDNEGDLATLSPVLDQVGGWFSEQPTTTAGVLADDAKRMALQYAPDLIGTSLYGGVSGLGGTLSKFKALKGAPLLPRTGGALKQFGPSAVTGMASLPAYTAAGNAYARTARAFGANEDQQALAEVAGYFTPGMRHLTNPAALSQLAKNPSGGALAKFMAPIYLAREGFNFGGEVIPALANREQYDQDMETYFNELSQKGGWGQFTDALLKGPGTILPRLAAKGPEIAWDTMQDYMPDQYMLQERDKRMQDITKKFLAGDYSSEQFKSLAGDVSTLADVVPSVPHLPWMPIKPMDKFVTGKMTDLHSNINKKYHQEYLDASVQNALRRQELARMQNNVRSPATPGGQ